MIEILTPLVWTQLWQVTLLFGGILLLSRTCLRRHPHGVHALWLVGLIKCLIPPLWSSHLGVFSWCQLKLEDAEILSSHAFGTVSSDWIRTQIRPSVAACLLAVWLAGVAFSAALVVMRWRSLRWAIRCSSAAVPVSIGRSMQRVADQLRVRNVLIYVTAEPVGPAVLGVFRKALILPQNLIEGLAESELEPILAHELLHVRRQDTWTSVLQVVANCLWWFHPLVWWGARDSSSQCERSVDADVLRILNYSPSAYARCLVRVLEARCRSSSRAGFGESECHAADGRAAAVGNANGVQFSNRQAVVALCGGRSARHADLAWFGTRAASPYPGTGARMGLTAARTCLRTARLGDVIIYKYALVPQTISSVPWERKSAQFYSTLPPSPPGGSRGSSGDGNRGRYAGRIFANQCDPPRAFGSTLPKGRVKLGELSPGWNRNYRLLAPVPQTVIPVPPDGVLRSLTRSAGGTCAFQPRSGDIPLAGCRQANATHFAADRRAGKPAGCRVENSVKNTGRLAPHRYLQPELSGIGRQAPVLAAPARRRPNGPTQIDSWHVVSPRRGCARAMSISRGLTAPGRSYIGPLALPGMTFDPGDCLRIGSCTVNVGKHCPWWHRNYRLLRQLRFERPPDLMVAPGLAEERKGGRCPMLLSW